MLVIYLLGIIITALGGIVLLYFLKKTFADEKALFILDWDGIFERGLITCLVMNGGYWLYAVPAVIVIRIFLYILSGGHVTNHFFIILRGKNPTVIDQRIKLKSEIAIDIVASPLIAILTGLILANFI